MVYALLGAKLTKTHRKVLGEFKLNPEARYQRSGNSLRNFTIDEDLSTVACDMPGRDMSYSYKEPPRGLIFLDFSLGLRPVMV